MFNFALRNQDYVFSEPVPAAGDSDDVLMIRGLSPRALRRRKMLPRLNSFFYNVSGQTPFIRSSLVTTSFIAARISTIKYARLWARSGLTHVAQQELLFRVQAKAPNVELAGASGLRFTAIGDPLVRFQQNQAFEVENSLLLCLPSLIRAKTSMIREARPLFAEALNLASSRITNPRAAEAEPY